MSLDLYRLGKVPWHESQLCYHALARLGREALVLVSPASRYVCVGYHQDARQEIDLDFCRSHYIPVFRREVGGGAVYLDGNQLFFQIILHRDSPLAPLRRETFYRKFLEPAIQVYGKIGIPAKYEPINDILAGSKKISGTGAGEIGDCVVFVGNLMIDFDCETMSRVLKTPDEKFRDRVQKAIETNVTNIRRELGEKEANKWTESTLNALMVEEFHKLLGPLEQREMDDTLKAKMDELGKVMTSESWLYRRGRQLNGRHTKIRSGVSVIHRIHKTNGCLIRADFEIRDNTFREVCLSTDLAYFPQETVFSLESRITGVSSKELRMALEEFFAAHPHESPDVTIEDWIKVFDP